MEFRILGPLEIVDDGRTITLQGTKKRALLTILLLHANEVVPRERLIDDLWGDDRPDTAATALHGYVSQLRKVLEPDAGRNSTLLVTRAPGYELRIETGCLDLDRFESLAADARGALEAGDADLAAETLRAGLALWRGEPLAEFGSTPFAVVENLRLEELRLSATEDRLEADLALGRHGAVIAELETLVANHPYRERLSALLMLALYRSGRQAEALGAYQLTRRRLVDELGIEPGRMLQDLERAILTHDAALDLPKAPADAVPVPTSRRRRARSLLSRTAAVAAAAVVAVAAGLAFALDQDAPSKSLVPNSVGFIDAGSGRVTKSFAVGREPSALAVTKDSVWVANYRDETVSRVDRETGRTATIPVGAHPTGIASFGRRIWVWTLEQLLVPIDPRFDSAGEPIAVAVSGRPRFVRTRDPGRITVGGGFLWLSAPGTTVVRVDPDRPGRRRSIVPDAGASGPLAYGAGGLWAAGTDVVFPIASETAIPLSGTSVGGPVRALAFARGSLWVVSGGPVRALGVAPTLRRVDPRTRLVETTVEVGQNPRAVAEAAGSIWVAGRNDGRGVIYRVDASRDRVLAAITVGSLPTTIAGDGDGVWFAVE